jgi:8-oxo-dGTP pyrophosphatase MutT (NUDIX family)
MHEPGPSAETIRYVGKLGEILHTSQPDGRVFERFRRPPGVRVIVTSPNGILLTREFRHEIAGHDLRLPGGKVFDDLESFSRARSRGSVQECAVQAATKEAREETGLRVRDLKLITIARAGATVEWDLYYFRTSAFSVVPTGPDPEPGEEITSAWYSPEKATEALRSGQMSEWRSVGVLLALVFPDLELW